MLSTDNSCQPQHEFAWRKVLLLNTIGGLVVPIVVVWFDRQWTWVGLAQSTLFSMMYSHSIGTIASIAFVAVGPALWRFRSGASRWGLSVLLLVACAFFGCLIATGGIVLTRLAPSATYWGLFTYAFRFCLPICLGVGIIAAVIDEAQDQLRATSLKLRTKELERERAEKLATEARLLSLESRIHPHFLFNALNSISSLIREDPERAERLIERMASLLRFSLDANQLGLVSLDRELKVVSDYLEIERARFGDRLQYRIEIPSELRQQDVPPLSLQTLVENSVKYAVSPRREGGVIELRAGIHEGMLKLEVRDDGPGFSAAAISKGHGLDLLQSRLETLFGRDAGVVVEGSVVAIRLPARAAVGA